MFRLRYETNKWIGKCPDCGKWNSFAEEIRVNSHININSKALNHAEIESLDIINAGDELRWDIGIAEFNRVLGGGWYPAVLY